MNDSFGAECLETKEAPATYGGKKIIQQPQICLEDPYQPECL